MKKIFLILVLLFSSLVIAQEYTGTYSIACYKCKKATLETNIGYSDCLGCAAWRCYDEEVSRVKSVYDFKHKRWNFVKVNPKMPGYAVFHCQHGHTLYVSLTGNERK